MRGLANVRMFVYPDSPAKRDEYLLYPKGWGKKKKSKEAVVVEAGKVENVEMGEYTGGPVPMVQPSV